MYVSLFFWLALLLPGYAVVRRFRPEDAESGLPGVVAPRNTGNAVVDLAQRCADPAVMLAEDTPSPQRHALLRQYHITLFRPDHPDVRWPRGNVREILRDGHTAMIAWDTDR